MEDTLKQIMVNHLGVSAERITPNASMSRDLAIDSLDALDLLMAINEELNLQIPPEAMEKVDTVQQLMDLIGQYRSSTL